MEPLKPTPTAAPAKRGHCDPRDTRCGCPWGSGWSARTWWGGPGKRKKKKKKKGWMGGEAVGGSGGWACQRSTHPNPTPPLPPQPRQECTHCQTGQGGCLGMVCGVVSTERLHRDIIFLRPAVAGGWGGRDDCPPSCPPSAPTPHFAHRQHPPRPPPPPQGARPPHPTHEASTMPRRP